MADDLLDCFLSAAADEFEQPIIAKVTTSQNEDSVFLSSITNYEQSLINNKSAPISLSLNNERKSSAVHKGDTDSSDDEENRDQNGKYNEFGKSIKHLLDSPSSSYSSIGNESTWKTKRPIQTSNNFATNSSLNANKVTISANPAKQLSVPTKPQIKLDVYTDPIFGIRIINPLISNTTLKERMQDRTAVPIVRLRRYVELIKKDSDWVVAGVIIQKSGKTSQKGKPFSIWTLSDLHNDLKTFSLFLFGSAYKELWKYAVGTVIGVLNPNIFEKKAGSKDEACLSVDNFQRVMIFGQSKDLGICKSIKKNGDPCNTVVNTNKCEYCVFHIKQEYQKCSKRSELQSNFAGQGLTALRNKVLGKNEVFYAGKSFMAVKSKKLQAKDEGRLGLLSGAICNTSSAIKAVNNKSVKKMAVHVEFSKNQKRKDLELIKKLGLGNANNVQTPNLLATQSSFVTLPDIRNKNEFKSKCNKFGSLDTKQVENSSKFDQFGSLDTKQVENNSKFDQFGSLNTKQVENNSKFDKVGSLDTKNDKNLVQAEPVFNFLDPNNLSDIEYDLSDTEIDDKQTSNKIKIQQNVIPKPNKSLEIAIDNNLNQNNVISKPTERNLAQAIAIAQKKPQISNPQNGAMDFPLLSGLGNTMVDLSSPIQKRHVDRAKMNAMKWVQRNGPIKKCDPNSNKLGKGKKRALENEVSNDPKKRKIQENTFFSQRFKKMMAETSKHTDLVEKRDNDEAEKYFNKLEMKEKMEEKMLNTFKVDCKAVRCLKCKYTNFSASDLCKQEKHPLKVFDAVKRFFKCGNCGNRTVSLDVVPILSCKNCGSGKWERSTMMREQKAVSTHSLSIRGGEQKFTNAIATDSHINLLVPDSGT